MSNISLSAASRTNLLTLQTTSQLIARTQDRLASGLAIKSPTDDAVKYFQAKGLSSRAQDLSERKDAIGQGVSTLEATLKAADSLDNLVGQIKGIVNSARSQTAIQRKEATGQIKELVNQLQKLIDDASYKGLNLLNSTGSTLSVRFSEKGNSKLDVNGINMNVSAFFRDSANAALGGAFKASVGSQAATGLGFTAKLSAYNISLASVAAAFNLKADKAILRLESTISNLRSKTSTLAMNSEILKTRLDFTTEYTNVLQAGSDKLTLADLNTEGANLLALQTRQQIGIQALSFAGQSEQSVLSLFR